MKWIVVALMLLQLLIFGLLLIFLNSKNWYMNVLETEDWDRPKPWYVRTGDWFIDHIPWGDK